jgi:putative ABC transport system permease protein
MDFFSMFASLPRSLLLGSILSLAVLGFSFSLRVMAYADLTLEGSFVLGAVAGSFVSTNHFSPLYAIPLALAFGALAGLLTASQHCFLRVNKLLSGIISFAVLYSLNLRLLGSPNVSFYRETTLFTLLPSAIGPYLVGGVVAAVIFLSTSYLLASELGLFIRAYGENSALVRRSGYAERPLVLVGLMFSNALIALSGMLFSQYSGYVDVGMGTGMLVVCLTSLVIGEIVIRPQTGRGFLLAILIGTALCQVLQAVCLQFNLHPSDYKGVLGISLAFLIFGRKLLVKRTGALGFGAEVF